MSMQASTIRILEAANFSPPQALALAEAIETEIRGSELVTVPVMDTRFAALDKRFAAIDVRFAAVDTRFMELKLQISEAEYRIFNKMTALGLTTTGIIITAVFFMIMNLKK